MQLHLDKYLDCVCEVRSLNNELLGVGSVDVGTRDELVLKSPDGHKLPMIHYNTQIKISILSKTSDFIILVGTVFTSTDAQMKLTGITTLQQYERRNFFRVNVNGNVILHPDKERNAPSEDDEPDEPIVCMMRDISLGGCLLQTEPDKQLKLGKKYIVEFVLVQVKHKLRMTVCRHADDTEDPSVEKKFGCSFSTNSNAQIDAVCKDLFILQRKIIQRKRGLE